MSFKIIISGLKAHYRIGQFYDVLHLLSLTGKPNDKHYLLFNGDLVDRGSWSIEVILLAFAYKCTFMTFPSFFCFSCVQIGLYPNYMFINRGNHEAKDMNRTYGFEGEAKHKHGEQAYKVATNLYLNKVTDVSSYLRTFSLPVSRARRFKTEY